MALVVITIQDGIDGEANVSVLCEPVLALDDQPATAAQVAAMNMLDAVTESKPLIQLVN